MEPGWGRGRGGAEGIGMYVWSTQTWPEMPPVPAQCIRSKATWEITELEHIDFPATDPGGSPDEGLQGEMRPCHSPPTWPCSHAAQSSPGRGLVTRARWAAGLLQAAARQCPLPDPRPVPEPGRSLRATFPGHADVASCLGAQGSAARGEPQTWGCSRPAHPGQSQGQSHPCPCRSGPRGSYARPTHAPRRAPG